MTFIAGLESLLASLRINAYSPKTIYNYANQLRQFRKWFDAEGFTDLRQINRAAIARFEVSVRALPVALETKGLRLRSVKRLFEHLVREGSLLINPTEGVREVSRKFKLPRPVLSVNEVARLINATDIGNPYGLRDRALLELLYSSAIRVGELERLRQGDMNLEMQTLRVHGKGSRARVVPLGQAALHWLLRYLDEVRPILVTRRPYERALFVVRGGRPLNQAHVRELLVQYQLRAGIKKRAHPHGLRHACATHLMQGGADIRVIQELLGHARLETTAIYTRVTPMEIQATHRQYHPKGGERADT
jgi:integrase/recombinase XerD